MMDLLIVSIAVAACVATWALLRLCEVLMRDGKGDRT
jgi:hypothetical protein